MITEVGTQVILVETTMVVRLDELGKPVTIHMGGKKNYRGEEDYRIDDDRMIFAVNAARLTGRVILSFRRGFRESYGDTGVSARQEQVQEFLDTLALHEGELMTEIPETEEKERALFRMDIVCTDHPTQRGRARQDAPPAEAKPSTDAGEPPLDPNTPGYR